MGLDCIVYENVREVGTCKSRDRYEQDYQLGDNDGMTEYIWDVNIADIRHPDANGFWCKRLGQNIKIESVYRYDNARRFFSRPYSAYGRWREWLRTLVTDVSKDEFYEDVERFQEMPFFSLIWFSDCDGYLGTEVCGLLYKDFEENLEKAVADKHPEGWYFNTYLDFMAACRDGSHNGFIKYC